MTRVLWVVKGLGPGGAERLLVASAGALDAGEVAVTCAYVLPTKDHLATDLESAGVTTVCLASSGRDARWPVRLARLVRSGGWDVVHVHSPLPGVVARVAARSRRSPARPALVTTEHNAWTTFHPATRWLNRLTIGLDDAVIAVSEETQASMSERVRERSQVVRHGIDVPAVRRLTAEREVVRSELGLSDDVVVLGTVANFRAQKDHPTLLAAMARLTDLPVHLVIVGQGPLEAAIRARSAELGLDDRVTFTGFRPDATRVMSAFDVFVLSSLWEGLPVALMEAAALGVPVVSTAVGGVAEVLTDGEDAVLVPAGDPLALADALRRVVTDDDLRARLSVAVRRVGDDLDVRRSTEEIGAVYTSVTAGRSPAVRAVASPPRRSPGPALVHGYDIRPATEADGPAILGLAARTLGWHVDDRHARLFAWKHDENPVGPSPRWVAVAGGEVVGLRVFLRWGLRRGDERLRAVRAVDTATDPAHQGKGLFTALTLHALDAVREEGVDLVFNTPNASSLPGYLKMGWSEVGRLPAVVRVAGPMRIPAVLRSRVPAALWSEPLAIGDPVDEGILERLASARVDPGPRRVVTDVDAAFLRWRYGAAPLGYRVVTAGEGAVVVRARRRGSALELVLAAAFGPADAARRAADRALVESGADHLLAIGAADPLRGRVPLPAAGPVLTFRSVSGLAAPPLANWALTLGDVELF